LPTLRMVDGGGVKADMLSYQMGEHGDVWRQLGRAKYDDIKLTLGLADVKGFWGWIEEFLKGIHTRKNGAIIAADYNYEEQARREFEQAIITELGFPKWDANAKDQANITVTMAPEKVVFKGPTGKTLANNGDSQAKQKHIAACNFNFSIDGYLDASARCTKVDAFAIKVKTVEHFYGTRLESAKLPGKMEWPNLVFYVPELDAEPFRTLHNDRMAGTRIDQGEGLTGTLTFFNNQKVEKGAFHFKGIHIFNVSAEKAEASSEEMKLTKVECAIERVTLEMA